MENRLEEPRTVAARVPNPMKPQDETHCPDCPAWHIQSRFCHIMNRIQSDENTMDAISRDLFLARYIPYMLSQLQWKPEKLHALIHESMCRERSRLSNPAVLTLTLGRSTEESLEDIIKLAKSKLRHHDNFSNIQSLAAKDDDLLPESIFDVGLRTVTSRAEIQAAGEVCPICKEDFYHDDFEIDSGYAIEGSSEDDYDDCEEISICEYAKKTPCGHHFCEDCLRQWRRKATGGKYTCPLCRCCLTCGQSDCRLHCVEPEEAVPISFEELEKAMLIDFDDVLDQIGARTFRFMREKTRGLRVKLRACLDRVADKGIDDARRAFNKKEVYRLAGELRGYVENLRSRYPESR